MWSKTRVEKMNEFLEIEKYGYFGGESYILSLKNIKEIMTNKKVGNTFPFIIELTYYNKENNIDLKFREEKEMRNVYREIVNILKSPKLVLS